METTVDGSNPSELQEKLAVYQELCDRRDRLTEQLRRTDAEKESVSSRIYDKVRSDYQAEFDEVVGQLDPLKEMLETVRHEVEAEMAGVDEEIRRGEDMISEAAFRHRVGEFDESTLQQATAGIEAEVQTWRDRRAELDEQLQAMDRRRGSAADAAPAPDPTPASGDPGQASPPPEETRAAVEQDATAVENPQEWFGEIPSSEAQEVETRTASPATAVADPAAETDDDEDPLAALADPSDERATPRTGTACLVFTSGSYKGRTVPLLPMTMSIGREHDNNIELKDPEVARYHARIVYENGEFLIQDMDSTPGIFVNGAKTVTAPLVHGDRIRIGDTELEFSFAP